MFFNIQRLLLAKEESVEGQDSSPTVGSNAIDAVNIKYTKTGEPIERNLARASRGQMAPIVGKRRMEISFDVEIKGSGTRGTAPKLGDLLEACGFSEAIGSTGGSSSVVYQPSNASHKSITIYVYEVPETGNAKLVKLTGARGNVDMKFEAGQIAMMSFKFLGKYNNDTDVSAPGTATYETTKPPIVESSTFTFNSVSTLVAQSVAIDMNNAVNEDEDVNAANGIKGFTITGRKPTGTFNPEAVSVATLDLDSLLTNTTESAMSLVLGSANGNKLTVSAPKVSIDSIASGDRNGKVTNEIPIRLNISTGADDLQLKFE